MPRSLARARVTAFEARTQRDSFYPMEVSSTAAERARLAALHRPLLLWSERRERPIRMLHAPPHLWMARGANRVNGTHFEGEAERGEFFVFQVRRAARAAVPHFHSTRLPEDAGLAPPPPPHPTPSHPPTRPLLFAPHRLACVETSARGLP